MAETTSTTSAADGPLASLYRNENNIDIMRYPKNLESPERSHVVLFTVKKIKPLTLEEAGKSVSVGKEIATAAGKSLGEAAVAAGEGNVSGAFSSGVEALKVVSQGVGSGWQRTYGKDNTETKAHISLYMPETLNFQYNAQYNEMRLLEAAASLPLVGRIASGIESVLEKKAAKVLMNRAGYIFNPQQQLLFEGIDFRTFQMAFTFSPVSKEESRTITEIIKTFRKYAAPEFIQESGGMFFRPPAVFDIDFRFKGNTNKSINKVKTCVIKDVDVNYAPNGWAAHTDGAPVQTTLTLTFQETALIDRAAIEQGY